MSHPESPTVFGGNLIASLVVAVIGFFIVSAVLMSVWNYTIPRIIASVDSSYYDEEGKIDPTKWSDISYSTAMVLLILISMVFAPFAIFREWRADRLLRQLDPAYGVRAPATHVGSGATLASMRLKRSRKSSIGSSK